MQGLIHRTAALLVAAALVGATALAREGGPEVLDVTALSSAEAKLDYAKSVQSQVSDADRYLQKLLEDASREGVESKIDCIGGWREQVTGLRKVTDREVEKVSNALMDASGSASVDSLLRGLSVLSGRANQFVAQAETCAGVQGKSTESRSTVDSNAQGLADNGDTDPLSGDSMMDLDPGQNSPFAQ